MRQMRHHHSIAAILCILGMPLLTLLLLTMAIATCCSNRLPPIQKATSAKMPTPKGRKHRSAHHLNKSPKSVDINVILADINLPQTRFKTILRVLGPAAERSNEMEEDPAFPEHYNPADDKADNSTLHPIRSLLQHPQIQNPHATLQ
jgi:hypothetical protein